MAEAEASPNMLHAAYSDTGLVREVNEDAYGSEEVGHGWLFVVADGMGGHQSGDVASRLAVKSILESFRNSTAIDPSRRLLESLATAHERIMARQGGSTGRERMGTTVVALYVTPGVAHYAWVGDSRIYLVRDGQISAITRDHTVGRELVDRGLSTPAEVLENPDAHKLSRALGMDQQWEPECAPNPLPTEPGDMLLMCSDGLYRMVPEGDALSLLLANEPVEAAIRLVEMANERGGKDNVTVQVVHVGSREAAVEAAAREGYIGSLTTELQALVTSDTLEGPPVTEKLGPGDTIESRPVGGDSDVTDLPESVALRPEESAVGLAARLKASADEDSVDQPGTEDPAADEAVADAPAPPESDEDAPTERIDPELASAIVDAARQRNEPTQRLGPGDTIRTRPVGEPAQQQVTAESPSPPEIADASDPPEPAEASDRPRPAPRAASLPSGPTPPPPQAAAATKPEVVEPVRVARIEAPRKRGPNKLVLLVGAGIGLLFAVLIVALLVTAAGLLLPRGKSSRQDVTASPLVPAEAVVPARSPAVHQAASAIRSVPEGQQCDQQWSLLRESVEVLAADPYTLKDVSGRVYRCFDGQALAAVQAFETAPGTSTRKAAATEIGHARRFLDPPSRADGTLRSVSDAVVVDLGVDEVACRLAELDRWETLVGQ